MLNNHQNALSYLQVQDGALESVGSIVGRMAEVHIWLLTLLKTPAMLKITQEFRELQVQLNQIQKQKFNGVSLFTSNSAVAAAVSADFNSDSTASYQHVNDQGSVITKTYASRSLQLLTYPSGQTNDGSISSME